MTNKQKFERKLIITDLDGTLLKNDETISDYTINVIKEITAMGHIVCIATGRPLRSSMYVYKALGLKTVIANLNGSILTNPSDKNFLPINLTFNKNIIKDLIKNKKIIQNIGCILVENFKGAYIISNDADNSFITKQFLNKFHINKKDKIYNISYKDYAKIDTDINSILIYIKNKSIIDELSFTIKSITATLVVRHWSLPHDDDGIVLEINSIFSNKGTTLNFLSSYYAIPLYNCYAFGDGANDLEMIKKCINGYSMKNASNMIKLISTKITKYNNDEDGVAKELANIFDVKLKK